VSRNIARKMLDSFVADGTTETFSAWVNVEHMDAMSFIIEGVETLTSAIDKVELEVSPESAEDLNDATKTPAITGPIVTPFPLELTSTGVLQLFLLDTISADVGPIQVDVPKAAAIRSCRLRVKMTTADATNFFTLTAWLIAKELTGARR